MKYEKVVVHHGDGPVFDEELLRPVPEGEELEYCEKCGERIPEEDMAEARKSPQSFISQGRPGLCRWCAGEGGW